MIELAKNFTYLETIGGKVKSGPNIKALIRLISKNKEAEVIESIKKMPALCGMTFTTNMTPLMALVSFDNAIASPFLFAHVCNQKETNVNAVNTFGAGVIHLLAKKNLFNLLYILISEKKDVLEVNCVTKERVTALSLASQVGAWETVLVLLNIGHADVAIPNRKKQTPLHLACLFGQEHSGTRKETLDQTSLLKFEDIIRALLEAGADPNTPDDEGLTPVHYLASVTIPLEARERMTRLLEEYGARFDNQSHLGNRPCDLAEIHQNETPEVAQLLKRHIVPPLFFLCLQKIQETPSLKDLNMDVLAERCMKMKIK